MGWRWIDAEEFVDVDTLRSLDAKIEEGIRRVQAEHGVNDGIVGGTINRFFPSLPDLRLDKSRPALSDLQTLTLKLPTAYTTLHLDEGCIVTPTAEYFPELMKWVEGLPFEQFGRTFIVFDDTGAEEPIHRGPVPYQEFLWFRSNPRKNFFTYDESLESKSYLETHAAWFDQAAYHGCDPGTPGELEWSIRVDGVFTPALREYIAQRFDAWTDTQRGLVEYFEKARDLAPRFPELSFTPEEFKEMVDELK
ncbi:MAG: hypothetical protein AAGE52_24435 [Myxococcota bacterium]